MDKDQITYQELLDVVKSMKSDEELLLFFLRACENKNFKICQLCLDAGIDINIKAGLYNKTLFQYFVQGGKFTPEVADWLIEHGADINIYYVYTHLAYACYRGDYNMAKYFIDKGMKIRQDKDRGKDGSSNESDLYQAVHGGNYDIVKMLIDLGVDLEEDAYPTENAYYEAIRTKKHKIVELFLQNGANTECYFYNFTPLHYATYTNDLILAKILLKYNANVNAEIEKTGRIIDGNYAITPMDIAQIKNNKDMQNLLLRFNGRASSREEKIQAILETSSDKPEYTKALKKILQKNQKSL